MGIQKEDYSPRICTNLTAVPSSLVILLDDFPKIKYYAVRRAIGFVYLIFESNKFSKSLRSFLLFHPETAPKVFEPLALFFHHTPPKINEIEVSKDPNFQYLIYRVYNLNSKNRECSIKIYSGPVTDATFKLEATKIAVYQK